MKKFLVVLSVFGSIVVSCNKDDEGAISYIPDPVDASTLIHTDKARYNPGQAVTFTIGELPAGAMVRYKHLGNTIEEATLSGQTWTWTPPSTDFKGYMAEVYRLAEDGSEEILGTVAIDVSSDWKKFPRYGFLSSFGQMNSASQQSVIDNLNDYHINGIQFYDWMYRQHQPLAGTPSSPMDQWNDIMNRPTYKATVDTYIDLAHGKSMNAMFYNLCYGVLDDYDPAQIPDNMFIYKDQVHNVKDKHELGPPFISDIYLTDPANTGWQSYLAQRNNDVYQVYDFDGFHIDQLGDRGNVYKYDGSGANLNAAFPSFISAMKDASSDKRLIFNAVNQYGQQQMASSELDFLYTEVWGPNEGFNDLATILNQNNEYSAGTKNTVLAAYVNYNKANNPGFFNTPGVLLADAVIFAMGGSHLELGEHMLAKEYFPNQNLAMTAELKTSLREYYDFLTAYQNLLRDGGNFNQLTINSGDGKMQPVAWPPSQGKVAIVAKQVAGKQVVHFLNFTNANSLNWRDTEGTQNVPQTITQAMVNVEVSGSPTKVWFASPDFKGGAAIALEFTQNGNTINVRLPSLKYWGMLVIE